MSNFTWPNQSADGNTVTLHRLNVETMFRFPDYFTKEWESANQDTVKLGAVIDVETTGLSQETDKVIEIGVRQFKFNRLTGEILSLEKSYSGFQDPKQPLSKEISELTGITDEMLAGQEIDWEKVNEILTHSVLVIAHNASFDRPFLDQHAAISKERIWGCSFQNVDWTKKGLPSQKLEILSVYHGFFNSAHRALSDAESLLYLLSLKDQTEKTPYFLELLNNARKPSAFIYATYAPFEAKDILRLRQYRWDNLAKVWGKRIFKDELEAEIAWLTEFVYKGKYAAKVEEVPTIDNFKMKKK